MKKMMRLIAVVACAMIIIGTVTYAGDSASVTQIRSSVNQIVDAVAYFGYAVAVAMLIFVGIKYAMSPANEKADVKQASVNYLIGAFLIICAATVANIFVDVAASGETSDRSLADEIIKKAQSAAGVGGDAGGGDAGGGDAGGGGGGR